MYRPGETIHYRALTLSRFRLAADRRMPVQFEILDPGGAPVPGLRGESVTQGGVACGRFSLPQGLVGGKYTLVARSIDGAFPDERREFSVRRYRLPELIAKLDFARRDYGPGDTVVADFSALRPEGDAAAGAELHVAAVLDGKPIHAHSARASAHLAASHTSHHAACGDRLHPVLWHGQCGGAYRPAAIALPARRGGPRAARNGRLTAPGRADMIDPDERWRE